MIWVPGVQIAHLRHPDHGNTAVQGGRGAPDDLRRASPVTRVTARTQSDGLFRCEPIACLLVHSCWSAVWPGRSFRGWRGHRGPWDCAGNQAAVASRYVTCAPRPRLGPPGCKVPCVTRFGASLRRDLRSSSAGRRQPASDRSSRRLCHPTGQGISVTDGELRTCRSPDPADRVRAARRPQPGACGVRSRAAAIAATWPIP